MNIHALRCATVTVKQAHRRARLPTVALRYLDIFLSQQFTEPLPVWTWVIEHPEGIIVIDTGENIRVFEPDYYSSVNAFVHQRLLKLQLDFRAEDQIAPQLVRLGIQPADVRWVIQTHLHTDHSGGLHAFPNAEILIAGAEWRQPLGAVPEQFPRWLAPTLVDYTDGAYHAFPRSQRLTKAGDVLIVPTPGHTLGHQSVVLELGDKAIFFAGDASFDQAQVREGAISGIAIAGGQARTTLTHIRQLGQRIPLVYLPAHDAGTADRLAARQVTDFGAA
ncbi:MAG: N-acyl homoserine lactonase family protein [Chloroflexota bacterium]|nr:N-acyl homoserine lactonase family protein [Chloroflexota bacterium]